MAAMTTRIKPIPHQAAPDHDLAAIAAGTTSRSLSAAEPAIRGSTGVTGPAFVVTACVASTALPFPTTTAPTMPTWNVQTYG